MKQKRRKTLFTVERERESVVTQERENPLCVPASLSFSMMKSWIFSSVSLSSSLVVVRDEGGGGSFVYGAWVFFIYVFY